MLPVYGQMNSYPHQSNQVPIPQYYIPTSENLPQQQMGPNPPNFPPMYMPWPQGSYSGYPTPCHVCCGHNGFPGGYYTPIPPCPHLITAPPLNCNHSAFPQACPVRYDPPPHYSSVQPRYEYDKSASHCYGCPNHSGCQKEDKGVKIEEMDAGAGKKGRDSLIPVQFGNHPYQVVWISPELLKKNELGGHEKVPSEVKLSEKSKPLHQEQKSWYPLDLKDQGGDSKKLQDEQDEDSQRKFSFPVIWMPFDVQKEVGENDNKVKDDGREMSKMPSSKHVEEPSSTFKVLPLKHADSSEGMGKPRTTQDNVDKKRNGCQRSIPVKQIGHHEEKASEDAKREAIKVPVKHAEDGVSKISESNGKRQSSAPSKISKLPPVCLRVDPLPRKKNGDGSSRSPSPPGQKRRVEAAKEMKPNRQEGRAIPVMDGLPVEDKKADPKTDVDFKDAANLPNEPYKEASASTTTEKTEDGNESRSCDEKSERVAERAAEVPNEVEQQMDLSKSDGGGYERQNKRSLTEAKAAALIQSVYRGFEVRRWDPLNKLKQIAEIRAQLADVRNRIEALESSEDMLEDNKQMAGVGEMIMRLLLKLDSIQGLHPSLREIRKSLARELVTLQEKLDSLTIKRTEEVSTSGLAHHVDTTMEVCAEEVQNQRLEESTLQSSCDNSVPVVDLPNSQCVTPESCVRSENGSESLVEQEEGLGVSEVAGSEKGDFVGTRQEQPVQLPSTAEEKASSEEEIIMEGVTEKLSGDSNGEAIKELDAKPTSVSGMGDQAEVEESLLARQMDGDAPADSVLDDQDLPAEVGHPESPESSAEMNVLEELPIGAVEADPLEPSDEKCEQVLQGAVESDLVVPKSESHEQAGSENSEIPSGERNHDDTVSDISSPKEECSGQQAPETVDIVESNDGLKVGIPASNEPPRDTALREEQQPAEQQMGSPPGGSGSQQGMEQVQLEDGNLGLTGDTQLELGGEGPAAQEMGAPGGEVRQFDDMNQEPVSCENEEGEEMIKAGSDRVDEQGEIECAHESSEHGLLVEAEATAVGAEPQEEANKKLMDEPNLETGSDKRLMEENEKLREMMAKLMEAGKEQLTVISELTGRVKDLEKKLSKKKKVRTMRKRRGLLNLADTKKTMI